VTDRPKIPKIIHQIWLGGAMPPRLASFSEEWRRLHPAWEYRLWTDQDMPALRHDAIFRATRSFAQKADILRYEVVARHGGMYVDADFEPIRPFDELVKGVEFVAGIQSGHTVCNGLFAARPHHPILTTMIDEIPRRYVAYSTITAQTGPDLLTDAVEAHRQRAGASSDARLLPHEYLYPLRPWDPPLEEPARERWPRSYAVHHWSKSWATDEQGLPGFADRVRIVGTTTAARSVPLVTRVGVRRAKAAIRRSLRDAIKDGGDRIVRRAGLAQSGPAPVRMDGGRLLVQTSHGFPILVPGDDLGVGAHLALTGSYEQNVLRYLERTVPTGAKVVDVGANIGLHTLVLARSVGPQGQVIAYECNPKMLQVLNDNLRLNTCEAWVEVRPVAVGTKAGSASFTVPRGQPGMGHITAVNSAAAPGEDEHFTVAVEPLRLPPGVVELLKIDIEGAETPVLETVAPRLVAGEVRRVMLELKADLLGKDWESMSDCLSALGRAGCRFSIIDHAGEPAEIPLADVLVIGEFGNLLIRCPDDHASGSASGPNAGPPT